MNPVTQITGENGNCITACIASFLELDIDDTSIIDVYSYGNDGSWMIELEMYFNGLGFELIFDSIFWDDFKKENDDVLDIHFACGKTTRSSSVGHCVLYEKGRLLHDPHPDGIGLDVSEDYFMYLIKKK